MNVADRWQIRSLEEREDFVSGSPFSGGGVWGAGEHDSFRGTGETSGLEEGQRRK